MDRLHDILSGAGFDPDQPLRHVVRPTTDLWIGEAIVVKLARTAPERLRRELAIADRVAPQVKYPEILARGETWAITQRAGGDELGRAWGTMTPRDRERAIRQLADMLDALHATETTEIEDTIAGPHAVTRADLMATAERAAHEVGNDMVLIYEVLAFIRERWDAAFAEPHDVLIHGDPHLENVLWDGKDITAVLDLEWARRGWRECDLEILLAVASHPALFAAEDYAASIVAGDYRAIPDWLRSAKPSWFAHAFVAERIALMFASRTLGHLVDQPGAAIRHRHLRALVGRA